MSNGDGQIPQKMLDHLTRMDELTVKTNELLQQLVATTKGYKPPTPVTPAQEYRQKLESMGYKPYDDRTYDMSTAVTDKEILLEGDFIHAWTDGDLESIGVRFNNKENPIVYFDRRNPITIESFWKIYITWPAQIGKTLDLFVGREASAQAQAMTLSKVVVTQSPLNFRCDTRTIDSGLIYYIGSGDAWGVNGLTVTGECFVEGEVHSFDDITVDGGPITAEGLVVAHP